MRAIDTNVLVRALLEDDAAQSATANRIVDEGVLLSATVLLETYWLLTSRFAQPSVAAVRSLRLFMRMPTVVVEDAAGFAWALDRAEAGADLADMLHLTRAVSADAFATFDRRIARGAGATPPVPVETLA